MRLFSAEASNALLCLLPGRRRRLGQLTNHSPVGRDGLAALLELPVARRADSPYLGINVRILQHARPMCYKPTELWWPVNSVVSRRLGSPRSQCQNYSQS